MVMQLTQDEHTLIKAMIGRVAEDKLDGTTEIKVFNPNITPAQAGSFVASTHIATVTTTNASGVEEIGKATLSNTLTATWWKPNRHQKYAPIVRKNEQIEIIQVGDSDKLYWREIGRDTHLHQEDVYRFEVAATKDINSDNTDDNTYYFEIDTVNKKVNFKTSEANGETVRYAISLDLVAGTFHICDNKENILLLESHIPHILLRNNRGTVLSLFEDSLTLGAPNSVTIKGGRQIVMETPKLTGLVSNSIHFKANTTYMENSSRFVASGSSIGINGSTTVIPGGLRLGGGTHAGLTPGSIGSLINGTPNDISG